MEVTVEVTLKESGPYVTVCTKRSQQVRMILPVVCVRSFIHQGLSNQYGQRAMSDNNVQDRSLD